MSNYLINGVEVTVEKDSNIDYEKYNFIWKLISFILNLLPSYLGKFLIIKSSKKTKLLKEKATTYRALDTLYINYKFSFKDGFLRGLINYFWFKLGNPRAVRNRLKLVKKF